MKTPVLLLRTNPGQGLQVARLKWSVRGAMSPPVRKHRLPDQSPPLTLNAPAPMDTAIPTAGGVSWDALDDGLMRKPLPGVFCAGEMIAWDAPAGGYLLTACLATGRFSGSGGFVRQLNASLRTEQKLVDSEVDYNTALH
jgi:hypothetical protein